MSPTKPEVPSPTIGQRLRDARRRAGITQLRAAQCLEMSRPTFINTESGKRTARAEEIVCLCRLYGCKVSDVMGGTAARLTKTDPLGMLAEVVEWVRRYDAGTISEGQLKSFLNVDRVGTRILRESCHAMAAVVASQIGPLKVTPAPAA